MKQPNAMTTLEALADTKWMFSEDTGSIFLIRLLQESEKLIGKEYPSPLTYFLARRSQITETLRLLEYIGLVEKADCELGWKPTVRLLQIVAKRAVRRPRSAKTMTNYPDAATIFEFLWPGDISEYQVEA